MRPVLILQNDIGNRFSPTVIVAAITAQIQKAKLPTHVEIDAKKYGFNFRKKLDVVNAQRAGFTLSVLDFPQNT